MAIYYGILLGLSTLLFIGPVLFYLIKSSISAGKTAGIAVALGIITGDIFCVVLAYTGNLKISEHQNYYFWIALIGGSFLVLLGLKYIFLPSISDTSEKISPRSLGAYFMNAFVINFVNPFVFAVWFGFATILQAKLESHFEVLMGLITILVVIFTTDILKAIYAERLARFISPSFLPKMYKFFGAVMVLFGIRILFTLL